MTATTAGLTRWEPENPAFWQAEGAKLARRTLWITTGALTLSFATWFMWSAMIVLLPAAGFHLTVSQLFWLAAIPGLVGATLRIPYSFLVQILGTRLVVTAATATLLIPSVGVGIAVQHPGTPFWVLCLLAASAGFGGGNFSAFMSSTSYFYPKARQGAALGIQAGVGNLGVSLVQLLINFVIGAATFGAIAGGPVLVTKGGVTRPQYLQNAAFLWVLPVLFFTIAAGVYLRSLPVKASFRDQAVIFKRKHNWVMTSLYLMTFGTFSGFAAAFALLAKSLFAKVPGAPNPLHFVFLGALIGSLMRPVAGWLADKMGGARLTLISGALLLGATIGLTFYSSPKTASDFWPFLGLMLVVFFAAGIGNGSTFRMIPVIFPPKEAGPVLGWTAAVAAYGAFIVPMVFKWSLTSHGSPNAAFYGFAVFYALNLGLCWWFYARKGAEKSC